MKISLIREEIEKNGNKRKISADTVGFHFNLAPGNC